MIVPNYNPSIRSFSAEFQPSAVPSAQFKNVLPAAAPGDLVVATCTMRGFNTATNSYAAAASAAYCFTLGGSSRGSGVGGVGVGGEASGVIGGRGVGGGLVVGNVSEDIAGSLSFMNEMGPALLSACERPVQVVSINAKTQQTVGSGVASDVNVSWPGFLTDKKTLFIHVPVTASFSSFLQSAQAGANGFGFRESVVAVLELAEDVLGVQNLVVCLDKDREDLANLIRSFLFVGFELVHPSVYDSNRFILVGSSF
ncbi:hypothetical protein HDU79_004246 [Rhizoclosmatium sp. JEL0117]|nr:hypothetical protein HDU79_004246 [Rhizoclosmatium sp. JEL0117]